MFAIGQIAAAIVAAVVALIVSAITDGLSPGVRWTVIVAAGILALVAGLWSARKLTEGRAASRTNVGTNLSGAQVDVQQIEIEAGSGDTNVAHKIKARKNVRVSDVTVRRPDKSS